MRMIPVALLLAALAIPVAAQDDDSLPAEERARLEAQLEQLQNELRELQRRLGVQSRSWRVGAEPMVWSFGDGNRARLGVVVQTSAAADAGGAELHAVTPNGPADEAGLRAGDVITRFNGVPLAGSESPDERLIDLVADMEDGDTARVEYRRDGQRATTTVVVEEGNGFFRYAVSPNVRILETDSILDATLRLLMPGGEGRGGLAGVLRLGRWNGMEMTTLDESLGRYFGTTEGLLVVKAPEDSLLGLRSGDVILRIGGRVPNSPSHAIRILRTYEPGDEIRLDVMRQRERRELRATVPEDDDR